MVGKVQNRSKPLSHSTLALVLHLSDFGIADKQFIYMYKGGHFQFARCPHLQQKGTSIMCIHLKSKTKSQHYVLSNYVNLLSPRKLSHPSLSNIRHSQPFTLNCILNLFLYSDCFKSWIWYETGPSMLSWHVRIPF